MAFENLEYDPEWKRFGGYLKNVSNIPTPILQKIYQMFVTYDDNPKTREKCCGRVFSYSPDSRPSFEEFQKTYMSYLDTMDATEAFYFSDL